MRLAGQEDEISSVAISIDGNTVATASKDGSIALWDLNGSDPMTQLAGHDHEVSRIAVGADGTMATLASGDPNIISWSLRDRREQRKFPHSKTHGQLASVAIGPKNDML